MTRELLELITDIRDFTTLVHVILRRETSGRFIKTENIKCDVCIIIVTSREASVTTKRRKIIHCAIHVLACLNHHVQGWNIVVKHVQNVRLS